MNQVPFKTSKAEGVLVRVPDDATGEHVKNYDVGVTEPISVFCWYDPFSFEQMERLPFSRSSLIGRVSDLTEQQWAEVVGLSVLDSGVGWCDYEFRRISYFGTATESGHSFMRSLGITEGNWVMILKR